MRRPAPSLLAVVAAVAAMTLAACSSTSNGTPTSAPSSKTSRSTSAPTGFPSSPSTVPSSATATTGVLTKTQAQAALLTAAEVGSGFTQTQSSNSDTPLPCTPNDPPLSTQFPPDVDVQADFSGAAGSALFSEEIETFADTGTVAQVIAAGEHGLSCGTAAVGGVQVQITGPRDVTAQLHASADKAEVWMLASSQLNASLIITQIGRQLTVFSFGAAPSVDTSTLPDESVVVTAALNKVNAALK